MTLLRERKPNKPNVISQPNNSLDERRPSDVVRDGLTFITAVEKRLQQSNSHEERKPINTRSW